MNICFFHNNGIIKESGGIGRITSNLVDLFRQHGIKVFLIGAHDLCHGHKYDKNQVFLPDEEHLLSNQNIDYLKNFLQSNEITVLINQAALSERITDFLLCLKMEYDVKIISCIHNSLLTPIINYAYQKEYILKKNGFHFVFSFLKTTVAKSMLKFIYIRKNRKAYRKLVALSDKIVSLFPQLNSELEDILGYCLKSKAVIIPNGINMPVNDNYVNKEKQNIIVWVGRADFSVKRLDYMLEIWKSIQNKLLDWKLIIAGDGPDFLEAKNLSSHLNLDRIEFLGRINPESIYNIASLLIVTSSHESFSLVTVEGMSRGVVPIVNNTFPAATIVTDGGKAGVLAPAFDLSKTSKLILQLCENKKKREIIQEYGVSFSYKYDLENIFLSWKSLLDEIA